MSVGSIYKRPFGRFIIVILQKLGVFRMVNRFLKSPLSRKIIPRYIDRHQIDMRDFEGQEYRSFAEFFARKRDGVPCDEAPGMLISPCDGLLTIYPITEDMNIPMKNSHYRLTDLVPDEEAAGRLIDGVCMVFRLRASDYHHFCAFDDAEVVGSSYIKGQLHTVQPIACEKVPVYRLNRRWWSVLDTLHFGTAVQVEVGAMLVGGVRFAKKQGRYSRGEEMGNFELAGSTILLMLSSDVRKQLRLEEKFKTAHIASSGIPIIMGEGIGVLSDETQS